MQALHAFIGKWGNVWGREKGEWPTPVKTLQTIIATVAINKKAANAMRTNQQQFDRTEKQLALDAAAALQASLASTGKKNPAKVRLSLVN